MFVRIVKSIAFYLLSALEIRIAQEGFYIGFGWQAQGLRKNEARKRLQAQELRKDIRRSFIYGTVVECVRMTGVDKIDRNMVSEFDGDYIICLGYFFPYFDGNF